MNERRKHPRSIETNSFPLDLTFILFLAEPESKRSPRVSGDPPSERDRDASQKLV